MSRVAIGRLGASGTTVMARYLTAVLAVVLATAVRWLLDPALNDRLPHATYFVAVAFVAWRCGFGPSILALVAGWWAASFFFFSPRHVLVPHAANPADLVSSVAYFVVGASNIAVCELMRLAQHRAAQSHELLRVTFASIGDAVITADANGNLTSLNAVAEHLTGWTQQQAEGKPLHEIFRVVNEQTREAVRNPVDAVLSEGVTVGLANHTLLIARDNTEHPIDDSAAPIHDADGNLVGAVLVFRDVTAQRTSERILRQSEARKTAILDTALDCIVTIDHEGKIVEFNPACERTFGYSRADAIGREMGDLIVPPSLRESHRKGFARYLATGEARVLNRRIELTAMRADGTELPVELAITRISGKGQPMFTGYLRDITSRKQFEERQSLLTSELNHRVKNTLAIVQSIANQSASSAADLGSFREAFAARLQAMARVHSVLAKSSWKGAEVREFAEATLEPYRLGATNIVELDGGTVSLPANAAVAVNLVLNELATNSAKYGALSQPSGRVRLSWRVHGNNPASLAFEWAEHGGPPVREPTRQGFGTKLIDLMARQLGGKASLTFEAEGLLCHLEFPLNS
jgi:PAS domain S-box-containing protein